MSKRPSADSVIFETRKLALLPSDIQSRMGKYSNTIRPATGDSRRSCRRDRDKILYSQAWRRLAGVTQVVSPDGEDLVLHTRLTHSEKVSQVAWSIGASILERANEGESKLIANLGGLDLDIVETAAMAHDLGHPPFGHLGETVLDDVAIAWGLDDGYEGNAQTFRILARLSRWGQFSSGMSLTPGTMAAVLKYPWLRGAGEFTEEDLGEDPAKRVEAARERARGSRGLYWSKFGAYSTEEDHLEAARSWLPKEFFKRGGDKSQTLEASIMDVADDITYAIHDLEDFVSGGFLRLDEIYHAFQAGDRRSSRSFYDEVSSDLERKYPSFFCPNIMGASEAWFAEFFERLRIVVSTSNTEGSLEKGMGKIVSDLLDGFIPTVNVSPEPLWEGGPFIGLEKKAWHQVHLLKSFTMRYVVNSPGVAAQQMSSRRLLRSLADDLRVWVREGKRDSLPLALRSRVGWFERDDAVATGASKAAESVDRLIVDYLASLTDHAARSLFARLNPSGADQIFGMAVL